MVYWLKFNVHFIDFRYFRRNLNQFSPYFMECSLTNMTIKTAMPSNSSLEGVLCTCNKVYCNNASSTDIHVMFSDAPRVSYLYLHISIYLHSILIVIINFTAWNTYFDHLLCPTYLHDLFKVMFTDLKNIYLFYLLKFIPHLLLNDTILLKARWIYIYVRFMI